jgi:hypothetical protein
METKKVAEIYFCERCIYKTSKVGNWKKHLLTRKHLLETTGNKKVADSLMECKFCNKKFKTRAGLWKHERKCTKSSQIVEEKDLDKKTEIFEKKNENNKKNIYEVEEVEESIDINISGSREILEEPKKKGPKNGKSNRDFVPKKRDKKNEELINEVRNMTKAVNTVMETQSILLNTINNQNKIIHDLVPKVGNTNHFNINVFLNETCKNAINMSDFVKSLQIKFEDLKYTNENGLIEGVTSVMVNGLKELKMDERPIHCTDSKRDVLYIKDNDSWEKESENNKLKTSIQDVATKQRMAINEWISINPDWEKTEKGKSDYLNLVTTVMGNDLGTVESTQKVIKTIAKETFIHKNEI